MSEIKYEQITEKKGVQLEFRSKENKDQASQTYHYAEPKKNELVNVLDCKYVVVEVRTKCTKVLFDNCHHCIFVLKEVTISDVTLYNCSKCQVQFDKSMICNLSKVRDSKIYAQSKCNDSNTINVENCSNNLINLIPEGDEDPTELALPSVIECKFDSKNAPLLKAIDPNQE